MPPIVSIVGNSKSGKTTLIEKLVGELRARGYRVATIKHTRSDFEIDHPGKDRHRLMQAGSEVVVLSGPDKVAFVNHRRQEAAPEELFQLVGGEVDRPLAGILLCSF